MSTHKTSLERAFELAQSGQCRTIQDIMQRLRDEKREPNFALGAALSQQLRALMAAASSSS